MTNKLLALNAILLVVLIGVTVAVLARVSREPKHPTEAVRTWKVKAVELMNTTGLRDGDLIIAVDGKQCRTLGALENALPGTFWVLRDGEQIVIESGPALGATVEPMYIVMRRDAAPL